MYPYRQGASYSAASRPRRNKRTHKRANVISNIAFSAVLVDVLITVPYCENTVCPCKLPRSVETTICIFRGEVLATTILLPVTAPLRWVVIKSFHYKFVYNAWRQSPGLSYQATKYRREGESGKPQLVNNGPMSVYGITTNKMRKCVWYLKSLGWLTFCQKQTVRQYVNDA